MKERDGVMGTVPEPGDISRLQPLSVQNLDIACPARPWPTSAATLQPASCDLSKSIHHVFAGYALERTRPLILAASASSAWCYSITTTASNAYRQPRQRWSLLYKTPSCLSAIHTLLALHIEFRGDPINTMDSLPIGKSSISIKQIPAEEIDATFKSDSIGIVYGR